MVTRWHYCISVEMVAEWVHWIVNVQRTLDCKKKTSTSPNRRERQRGREGEKEREWLDCFLDFFLAGWSVEYIVCLQLWLLDDRFGIAHQQNDSFVNDKCCTVPVE